MVVMVVVVVVPPRRCCPSSALLSSLVLVLVLVLVVPGLLGPPVGRWSSRWLPSSVSRLIGVVVVVVTLPPRFLAPFLVHPGRNCCCCCSCRCWCLLLFLSALVSFCRSPGSRPPWRRLEPARGFGVAVEVVEVVLLLLSSSSLWRQPRWWWWVLGVGVALAWLFPDATAAAPVGGTPIVPCRHFCRTGGVVPVFPGLVPSPSLSVAFP
jgi:hypothetical protein